MIDQPYPYYVLKAKTHYAFESVGTQGNVYKIVQFTLRSNGHWNLGFGDWKDRQVDGSVITNNHDVYKVIGTVAKITIDFLKQNPESIIDIKPVDEKRKTLYNRVFQRYFDEINPLFQVYGLIEEEEEPYKPTKIYDSFTIELKSN